MQTGIELIAAERKRQVEEKGYSASHDDTHVDGSIADAAALVACAVSPNVSGDCCSVRLNENYWPVRISEHFGRKYRDSPIRLLSIAGALIAAEIDRLNREG